MSLTVEITPYTDARGITRSLEALATKFNKLLGGNDTQRIINGTVCKGILQNDISLAFNNSWGSTAYQGLYGALGTAAKTNAATFSFQAVKAAIDVANTTLNMGGVSMVGAGAASTRIYQGSSMSGFTTVIKWYTPRDPSYIESIRALLLLGFPALREQFDTNDSDKIKEAFNTNTILKAAGGAALGALGGPLGMVLGAVVASNSKGSAAGSILGDLSDSFKSLMSYNPPVLCVKIIGTSNTDVLYNIYPVVISNITLNASRETYTSNGKRIPIVITASIAFDFYQIYGNNGYLKSNPLVIAGVDVLTDVARNG